MILLRKLRHERGISTNQLAKEVGIDRFAIINIENKQYKSATNNMKKLADYFGIKNPTDLTMNVDEVIQAKSCNNQRCLLNKQCYCQSEKVIEGAFCQNQGVTSNPVKEVKLNSTQALFI